MNEEKSAPLGFRTKLNWIRRRRGTEKNIEIIYVSCSFRCNFVIKVPTLNSIIICEENFQSDLTRQMFIRTKGAINHCNCSIVSISNFPLMVMPEEFLSILSSGDKMTNVVGRNEWQNKKKQKTTIKK